MTPLRRQRGCLSRANLFISGEAQLPHKKNLKRGLPNN
jgi:hypothetical protein